MTRREALIAIRDLVERGEWVGDWRYLNDAGIAHKSSGRYFSGWAYNAFRGDLSAGGALLQRVLPGWIWAISSVGPEDGDDTPYAVVAKSRNDSVNQFDARSDAPARALLLAILEALIAKEGDG